MMGKCPGFAESHLTIEWIDAPAKKDPIATPVCISESDCNATLQPIVLLKVYDDGVKRLRSVAEQNRRMPPHSVRARVSNECIASVGICNITVGSHNGVLVESAHVDVGNPESLPPWLELHQSV